MRIYKTRIVPESEEKITDKILCDMCGEVITRETYLINGVTVMYSEGTGSSDCGAGTDTIYDICPKCWKTKLVPFFDSLDVTPHEEEWDW